MPSNSIENISGVANTSGAQTVVIAEFELPDDSVGLITAAVTGQNLSSGASCAMEKMGIIKKIGSGDAEVVGSLLNILPATGDLALILSSITIDTSGNKVRVKATGVLLQDIEWYGTMKIQLRTQS